MSDQKYVDLFESRRKFLIGLAYRILGSLADAEDVVQDTFIKWLQADRCSIQNPAAWLTTICTRHCIDLLRSAQRSRVDYTGVWLPEPIQTTAIETSGDGLALSSSLSMAFLLLLERLAPKERAAYVLHDIFDLSYADIAATLGGKEVACRKLVSRARVKMGRSGVHTPGAPPVVSLERQEALLTAFRSAVETANIEQLSALLSEDAELSADGGGKVPSNLEPLAGKNNVLAFIAGKLGEFWRTYEWRPATINGLLGALLFDQGHVRAAVSFSLDARGYLSQIFIVRNPSKLARLGQQWEMPLQ